MQTEGEEGMGLTLVLSLQGSGKTLWCVNYVLNHYCRKKEYDVAYSNVKILPYEGREIYQLDKAAFMNLGIQRNALVLMDEIYLWLDSRRASSKANVDTSYLVLQSRKRGFEVLATAQLFSSVDVRMRDNSDKIIHAFHIPFFWAKKGVLTENKWDPHDLFFERTEERARKFAGLGFKYLVYRPRVMGGYNLVDVQILTPEMAKADFPYYDTHEIVPFV